MNRTAREWTVVPVYETKSYDWKRHLLKLVIGMLGTIGWPCSMFIFKIRDCANHGRIPDVVMPSEDFERPSNTTPKVKIRNETRPKKVVPKRAQKVKLVPV